MSFHFPKIWGFLWKAFILFNKKLPYSFPNWSLFYIPSRYISLIQFLYVILMTFDVVTIFYFSHSGRCRYFFCGFTLHFPNGYWWWMCFHMLICHQYNLFSALSIYVFYPFSTWIVFLLLSFESSAFQI